MFPTLDDVKGERYEIGKIVGTGAFATVHEARDLRLDSRVAIKVLAQNWAHDPSVCERFGREATLLRRVRSSHRNAPLAEVFDIDQTEDGRPYFVMSFADRGTLSARWSPGKPWRLEQVLPVIDTLTEGLSALHSEGVVHRDIKPSNMLYVSQPSAPSGEELLIGDLGLAKDTLTGTSELTVAGGTPGYMAPEQAHPDSAISPGADIYAATILVAELLTGVRGPAAINALPTSAQPEFHRGASQTPHERHPTIQQWRTQIVAALTGADSTAIDPSAAVATDATRISVTSPGSTASVSDSATSNGETGGLNKLVVGGLAGLAAVVLAVVLALFVFSGSASIDIDGPNEASVGETIFLRPDLPEGTRSHSWRVSGQEVTDADLRLTPSSIGPIIVELTATLENGDVETVSHRIDVS